VSCSAIWAYSWVIVRSWGATIAASCS